MVIIQQIKNNYKYSHHNKPTIITVESQYTHTHGLCTACQYMSLISHTINYTQSMDTRGYNADVVLNCHTGLRIHVCVCVCVCGITLHAIFHITVYMYTIIVMNPNYMCI